MLDLILQLLLLFLFSVTILSLIETKWLKISLLSIFVIFISLEVNSIFLGGTLIDYKFYQHLNFETIWAVKGAFVWQTTKVCKRWPNYFDFSINVLQRRYI